MQRDGEKDLVPRFWLCLLFTFPFFVRNLEPFIQWMLATIVLVVGNWSFYRKAWKQPQSIYTLFCISVSLPYLYSVFDGLLSKEPTLYDSTVATVTLCILLEQLLESVLLQNAAIQLQTLRNNTPKTAHKLFIDGRTEVVAADVLKEGDTVRVDAGELVPVDGVIFSGEADLQEYGQTVHKVIGSQIFAGTKVLKGSCLVRAIRALESSLHNQRIAFASNLSQESAPKLALVAAGGLSIAAFLLWSLLSGVGPAVLTVSAISLALAPCALLFSKNLTREIASNEALKAGIVIRSQRVFDEVAKCNLLVVNKNGTLTVAKPQIVSLDHVEGVNPDELLQVAASLESNAIHPYAQCIIEKAVGQNISLLQVEGLEEVSGLGVKGKVAEEVCQIGDEKLLGHVDLGFYKTRAEDMRKQGYIVLFCAKGHKLLGIIVLSDPVRHDVKETLKAFKDEGFSLFCLSADRRITVVQLVGALGFDRFQSEAPSQQKIYTVQKLQKEGRQVLMVGDPKNDEAALVQANAGVALGTKGNLLQEKAPITLLQGSLSSALTLFTLAKRTRSIMAQNQVIAIACMVILAILALFGVIGPAYTALYMLASCVIVGFNCFRVEQINK